MRVWIEFRKFQSNSSISLPYLYRLLRVVVVIFVMTMSILPLSGSALLDPGERRQISKPTRNRTENSNPVGNSPFSGLKSVDDNEPSWTVIESVRVKRGTRNPRKQNNLMSFGQLQVLAVEEAKCLQDFGGQRNKTTTRAGESVLYIPSLCSRSSEEFAQCEQCRNLTAFVRSPRECESYCGRDRDSCIERCNLINDAVRNQAGNLDNAHYIKDLQDNKNPIDSNNNSLLKPVFNASPLKDINNPELNLTSDDKESPAVSSSSPWSLRSPEVFCEGVNRPESPAIRSEVSLSIDQTDEGTKNHFVLLKWQVLYHRDAGRRNGLDKNNLADAPLVFIIEKFSNSSPKWQVIGKTVFSLQMVSVAYPTDTYKWRITAVSSNGIVDEVTSVKYVTLDGYLKPGPPKRIYVVDTEPNVVNSSLVNVLIGWDPPKEKACFYKVTLVTDEGDEATVRIKEERIGFHRVWFDNLGFGTRYSVLITSRDPSFDHNSQSNLTKIEFVTPTCLELYRFSFDKCAPPPPSGLRRLIQMESSDENGRSTDVILSWNPPQNASESNPITKYLVAVTQRKFKSGGVGVGNLGGIAGSSVNLNTNFSYMNINDTLHPEMKNMGHFPYKVNTTFLKPYEIPGNQTEIKLKDLPMDARYTALVTAFSSQGPSTPAQFDFILQMKAEAVQSPLSNWLYLTIPVSIVMLVLLTCNVGRVYLHKRQVKLARNQYFQSMEERDAMSGDWSIVPLTEETSTWKLFDDNFPKERWEIMYEHLTMGEVIGQGAFGVVRRAKIPRKKLQSTTLKFLDKQNHYSSDVRTEKADTDMETVAVKMLKVSATREDREQLIKEIMTMQSLGFHPQIVGLIGACTKGRSLCLVLEYCPGGDLLTFIRKVRAKYWPTMGLSDAKKSSSLSSIMSPEETTASRSFGSGGSRSKKVDGNSRSVDDSPINYADIEGFSDCSSSSDKQGNVGELTEDSRPRSRVGEARQSPSQKSFHSNATEEDDDEDFRPIDEKDVLSYARQIAMGMEYLEKNRIVHRDLAGRNCLLMGDHKQVKLSDFGLSRDIYTWNVYHQKSNGKLPIKWMAIESIFSHVFTTKSDVWSYGILLWELVTLGGTPYPGLGNTELFHLLKSGYRMERPDNCSEEVYAVMKKCWRTSPAARPNFTELRHHVETMMEAAEPNLYLSLMADIPSDYFRLGGSQSDLLQMNPEATGESGLAREGSGTGNDSRSFHNHNGNPKTFNRYAGYHNTNAGSSSTTSNPRHSLSSPGGSVPTDSISNTPGKYNNNNNSESGKSYSRSNSNSTNGSSGISRNSSVSGRSCSKFTLGNVPRRAGNGEMNSRSSRTSSGFGDSQKRRSLLRSPDSGLPRSSEVGFIEGSPANNSVSSSAKGTSSGKRRTFSDMSDSDRVTDGRLRDRRDETGDIGTNDIDPFEVEDNASRARKETASLLPFNEDYNRESISDEADEMEFQERLNPVNPSARLPLSYPFRHVNNMTIIENKTYDLPDD